MRCWCCTVNWVTSLQCWNRFAERWPSQFCHTFVIIFAIIIRPFYHHHLHTCARARTRVPFKSNQNTVMYFYKYSLRVRISFVAIYTLTQRDASTHCAFRIFGKHSNRSFLLIFYIFCCFLTASHRQFLQLKIINIRLIFKIPSLCSFDTWR